MLRPSRSLIYSKRLVLSRVRGLTQVYNQQWEGLRETLEELREGVHIAVEEQIRLEMPWEYESVEPDPAAKAVAENWATQFLEELEDVDDDYFGQLTTRMEDGCTSSKTIPSDRMLPFTSSSRCRTHCCGGCVTRMMR